MKLTTKGRYAVSALTDIAAHGGDGHVPLSEIAVRQGISIAYLEQLFSRLRRAGLVTSIRGASGGYALAVPPTDLTVGAIVAAADEEVRTTACAPGSEISCQGTTTRCLTHQLWDELGRQIELFMDAVTLEDIVQQRVRGVAAVNEPRIEANEQPLREARQ